MKILFTATYAQPYLSGITDYIATITEHLSKNHPVTLLTFQHTQDLPLVEKRGPLTIHRIPVHARISKGLLNWAYPWIAWQTVRQHDQIVINLPQVESLWIALAAKLQGKPLTVIYHCELVFDTGWSQKCIAWAANFLARLTCQLANQIVVYTQDYADHSPVLKGLDVKITPILPPVILSTADSTFSLKLRQQFPTAAPLLGFSGRVSREKGLGDLLTALTQLKEKYPRIQLVCAGPYGADVVGESTYYQTLNRRIQTQKLPIHFLGRLSKAQLMAFYATIDILILPSTNRTEAFGLVQVEALSAGTPVITTDLPGVRMAVKMTNGGEVVPVHAPEILAKAIESILIKKQAGRYKKLAENAKKLFQLEPTLAWFSNHLSTPAN